MALPNLTREPIEGEDSESEEELGFKSIFDLPDADTPPWIPVPSPEVEGDGEAEAEGEERGRREGGRRIK